MHRILPWSMLFVLNVLLVICPLSAMAAAPNAPTSLQQFRGDGTTSIAANGWTNQTLATFKFQVSDADAGSQLTPYVEVVVSTGSFSGVCGTEVSVTGRKVMKGNPVFPSSAGTPITATVNGSWGYNNTAGGLAVHGTQLKWRACVLDNTNTVSGWTSYGTIPAFGYDTVPPALASTTWTASSGTSLQAASQLLFRNNTSGSGTVTAGYSDTSGIKQVVFQLGQQTVTDTTAPFQYPYSWAVGALDFQITATPTDLAGNSGSESDVLSAVVDNNAPAASLAWAGGSIIHLSNNGTGKASDGIQPNTQGFQSATSIMLGTWQPGDSAGLSSSQAPKFRRWSTTLSNGLCGSTWTLDYEISSASSLGAGPSYTYFPGGPGGSDLTSYTTTSRMDTGNIAANKCYKYGSVATDALGNAGTYECPSDSIVKIDTSQPTNLRITNGDYIVYGNGSIFDGTSTNQSFTVIADDNHLATQATISIDGTPGSPISLAKNIFGSFSGSTAFDLSQLTEGAHTMLVTAQDAAGNTTSTPTYTIYIDRTAPTSVSVASPAGNQRIRGAHSVSITAQDTVKVAALTLSLDGTNITSSSTPVSFTPAATSNGTFQLDTLSLLDGVHQLQATATDATGRQTVSSIRSFIVDNTAPNASITLDGALPGPTYANQGSINLTAETSDTTSQISSVALALDGTAREMKTDSEIPSSGNVPFTIDASALSAGSHSIRITATDSTGNQRVVQQTITIDSAAPTNVVISQPSWPSWPLVPASATFEMTAVDDSLITIIEWFMDGSTTPFHTTSVGSASAATSTSWISTSASNGSHSLRVRATDQFGRQTLSDPLVFTVDNSTPTAGIVTPIDGAILDGQQPINVSTQASQPANVSSVRLYVDDLQVAERAWIAPEQGNFESHVFSWDASAVSSGTHNVKVASLPTVTYSQPITVTIDQAPPATAAITAPAAASWVSGIVPVSMAATDDVGVESMQLSVDGTLLRTLNSSTDFVQSTSVTASTSIDSTLLTDGSHEFVVTAFDRFGRMRSSAPRTVNVDNTGASGTISNIDAGDVFSGVGIISVSAGFSDASGVVQAQLFVDEVVRDSKSFAANNGSSTSLGWNATTDMIGSHVLRVRLTDRAGNISNTPSVPVIIDRDSPTSVSVSSPVNGSTVAGTVAISGTATDDVGITRVEFFINGTPLSDQSSPHDFTAGVTVAPSFAWDTTHLTNATYTVTMRAYDGMGRIINSAPSALVVDNTPPSPVVISSPAASSRLGKTISLTGSATKLGSTITKMEWLANDSVIATRTAPSNFTAAPIVQDTATWDTVANGIPDGSYAISVRATDALGRFTVSASRTIIVDNSSPVTAEIVSPSLDHAVRGMVPLQIAATDGAGIQRIELFVDGVQRAVGTNTNGDLTGVTTAYWSTPLDTTTLSSADEHVLRVRAYDMIGNFTDGSVRSITVDNNPPSTPILLSPEPGSALGGSVVFRASASDTQQVKGVDFLISGSVVSSSQAPIDFNAASSVLVERTYDASNINVANCNIRVRATDDAGNTAMSDPVSCTTDNLPPIVTVTQPPPSVVRAEVPTVISASAQDASGVDRITLLVDGLEVTSTTFEPATSTSQSIIWHSAADVSSGTHQIRVSFTDRAGNRMLSVAYPTKVDKGPPIRSEVISHQNGDPVSGSVNFLVQSTDDLSFQTIELIIDDAIPASRRTFTRPITSTSNDILTKFVVDTVSLNIPDGVHTITTVGRDLAGREASSTITVTVKNDIVAPVNTSLVAPAGWYVLTPYIPFGWRATDNQSVAGYDTRIRFGASVLGDRVDWLTNTTNTSASYTATARGTTYCASMRAYDPSGNISSWSQERCAAVPLDDRDLTRSGSWTRATPASAYAATTSTSKTIGASLSTNTITTRTLALVATRCTGCGTVAVFWNNRLIKTINLAAANTQSRSITPLTSFTTPQTGKLVVRVALPGINGTTIDGVITSIG